MKTGLSLLDMNEGFHIIAPKLSRFLPAAKGELGVGDIV